MQMLARMLIMALLLAPGLLGLNLKVETVDAKRGKVRFLLPMHSARLEVTVLEAGEATRVKRHEFYEGGFLRRKPRGSLDAILRVKIPDAKPVNFRVHKIIFLEQPVQPVSSW